MTWRSEALLGLAVLLAGLWLAFLAIPQEIRVAASQTNEISPAFFPRIVAWLFVLFGGGHAIFHVLQRPAAAAGAEPKKRSLGGLHAMAVLAIGAAYAMLLPRLGFLPATVLGLAALTFYLGGGPIGRAVLFASPFAVLLHELFARLLGTPLPRAGWWD